MAIKTDKERTVFNLQTPHSSYILSIFNGCLPLHLHYGKRIESIPKAGDVLTFGTKGIMSLEDIGGVRTAKESLTLEYPVYGASDLRTPAFHAKYTDGSRITDWEYAGCKIYKGKKKLSGLPAVYTESDDEADSLEIELFDQKTGLRATLKYTAFNNYDAITRSVLLKNEGGEDITLESVQSCCVDFMGRDYDLTYLAGGWACERSMHTVPLDCGSFSIDSKRGISSHNFNPFIMLTSKGADENCGDAYGFSLVYSGNFIAAADVASSETTRVYMGINPFDFSWKLAPGESFQTPEAVLVYSGEGTGAMSRTYHRLYRERLCRGKYRDAERPVLINNWEGTYFDFNEQKILNIAAKAKAAGVELMVLDDGWFGERNDDTSSLGDWYPNLEKLPGGVTSLAEKVEALGMKFGIWFEPEMVSPNSRLFREHPEWCMRVAGRKQSICRHQYVLDLSRQDVCDFVYNTLAGHLKSARISYIKWDMNRSFSEIGSALLPPERQGEVAHRYVLGLYSVMERLNTDFPDVLFEGCCSGGGRFDPGILYYSPQIWTSDCSDAAERLFIQHGTSLVYPFSTMGAHVSASPNHQVYRSTSLKMRGDAAVMGQFGYELDITSMSDDELAEVREQIEKYKRLRGLFHKGDMYRLESPFDSNYTVWEFVSEDKSRVAVCIYRLLAKAFFPHHMLKLRGLDESAVYVCEEDGREMGGDTLAAIGLNTSVCFGEKGDFVSKILIFNKK